MSNNPLRVALYSPRLPHSGGSNGIITYTRIMRDALRAAGHRITVLSPEEVEHEDGSVVPLPRANPVIARARKFLEERRVNDGSNVWVRMRLFDAFRVARKSGVQILEMEESFGWAGQLAERGVPIVERLHGPHAFVRSEVETAQQTADGDRREAAERESIAKVQAVTAPTRRLLDALIQRYGICPGVSAAIPNPMPVAGQAGRWRLEAADPDQMLFVGRFDLCKGADVVLRAFARAVERKASLKLVVAGPDHGLARADGGLTHFGEFVTTELSPHVRERIHYVGEQPLQEVTKLRLQSALTLVGSRFENFPYGIAEAMAQGMPIITSATFGGSEMVRDNVDGKVVPIADVQATSDAILEMMSNPPRLAEMGQAAYKRVATWLAPERIAAETVKLYRTVIAEASKR